jgi:hypothetical protein
MIQDLKEFKALRLTRAKNIEDQVHEALQSWTLAAVALFLKEVKLIAPHLSTVPFELERLYEKELSKPELRPFLP